MEFVIVAANGARQSLSMPTLEAACAVALRRGATVEIDGALRSPAQVLGLDRPGIFDPFGPEWVEPSGDEVRAVMRVATLTGGAVAKLVGVDGRTVRKWVGSERPMPYSAWRLLCIYIGLVEADRMPPP